MAMVVCSLWPVHRLFFQHRTSIGEVICNCLIFLFMYGMMDRVVVRTKVDDETGDSSLGSRPIELAEISLIMHMRNGTSTIIMHDLDESEIRVKGVRMYLRPGNGSL